MANLIAIIVIICFGGYMAIKPDKFMEKKITKLEQENGGPLPQEEKDKKYKNIRIIGIVAIVFAVVMMFI